MSRGEIYKTREKVSERGHKPGFYVVVSRNFVATNDDISTVVCAPVYRQILGIRSEVILGADDGLDQERALRCDFLSLMFKRKLTRKVGSLSEEKLSQLDDALAYALGLET